jgi:hypothetical protein
MSRQVGKRRFERTLRIAARFDGAKLLLRETIQWSHFAARKYLIVGREFTEPLTRRFRCLQKAKAKGFLGSVETYANRVLALP